MERHKKRVLVNYFYVRQMAIQKWFLISWLGIESFTSSIFQNTNQDLKILQVPKKCTNYTNSN